MSTDVIEAAAPPELTDGQQPPASEEEALTAEDLIEEVSIDGMCGVY